MNPRVLLWLRAHDLTEDDIRRDSDGDVRMLTLDGVRALWTWHYSTWIMKQWDNWAANLGFTKRRDGYSPHELALLAGHKREEFDAWLKSQVLPV